MALESDFGLERVGHELLVQFVAKDRDLEVPSDGHDALHELVLLCQGEIWRFTSPDVDTVEVGARREDDTGYEVGLGWCAAVLLGLECLADSCEHLDVSGGNCSWRVWPTHCV